ncbi:hypothetical protein LCGC14_2243170, partial [marine sediment metagenome]
GILTYVPVHGGITFARETKFGTVYGFDTAHLDSEKLPRDDHKWIKKQCKIMIDGILKAAEVEDNYLHCKTNKGKAKWAQMIQDINPSEGYNFGVGIKLLSGEL